MSEQSSPGRAEIRSHRDLRVWQLGLSLTERIYALTRGFPEDERFDLALQLRRAAVGVPSNVAEGFARGSARDYARFLTISLGSIGEIETQLLIARDLPRVDVAEIDALLETPTTGGRMLDRLLGTVRMSHREQAPSREAEGLR